MKTQYFRNPNISDKAVSPRAFFLGALLVGVIVILLLLRAVAPGAIVYIAKPFWFTGNKLTASVSTALNFESKKDLLQARDSLTATVTTLENENAVLTSRVSDLQKLLGSREETTKGIVASVLIRPPVSPYDTLVIDQGERAGITKDALVYGQGGIPAGVVTEVMTTTSRVTLYSAPSLKTQGWAGAEHFPLTLIGAGAGAYEASIPKDSGVVVGDGVYLSVGGASPLGVVTMIDSDPSSPTVVLHVRPFINPFSLTFVTVSK